MGIISDTESPCSHPLDPRSWDPHPFVPTYLSSSSDSKTSLPLSLPFPRVDGRRLDVPANPSYGIIFLSSYSTSPILRLPSRDAPLLSYSLSAYIHTHIYLTSVLTGDKTHLLANLYFVDGKEGGVDPRRSYRRPFPFPHQNRCWTLMQALGLSRCRVEKAAERTLRARSLQQISGDRSHYRPHDALR